MRHPVSIWRGQKLLTVEGMQGYSRLQAFSVIDDVSAVHGDNAWEALPDLPSIVS